MTLSEKETNFNLIISEFCIAWSLVVIENIQLQMIFSAWNVCTFFCKNLLFWWMNVIQRYSERWLHKPCVRGLKRNAYCKNDAKIWILCRVESGDLFLIPFTHSDTIYNSLAALTYTVLHVLSGDLTNYVKVTKFLTTRNRVTIWKVWLESIILFKIFKQTCTRGLSNKESRFLSSNWLLFTGTS